MAPEQAAQTATQYWLQLSWGDTLAIIGLILSFVGQLVTRALRLFSLCRYNNQASIRFG